MHGGNLVFNNPQDAQSMDESTVFDNNSIWILEQIMQPLYTVTKNGKGTMPWLATGYKVSSDLKTYTISLRKGVEFSNGKPMTAADRHRFSLDETRAAASGWGYIDTAISSVDAPSPSTVVIHLKFPWAPLLADLSLFANGIVPNNYGGKTATQFYQAPVGTGPFKWDYWHKGQAVKLVKNPHYWQPGLPYLNSVTWTDVPSDNTRQLQIQGGQAQIDQFPVMVDGWRAQEHARRGHGPVQLHGNQLPGLQREGQAVPGRARAPGHLAGHQPGRDHQGGAVRQR